MPTVLYTTTYTPELVNAFICRLSSGRSLAQVCRDGDMPGAATVYRWMRAYPDFAAQVEMVRDRSHGCAPGGRREGRYSEALAQGICAALAEGFTLKAVCASDACPVGYGAVMAWVAQRPDFAALYHAACAPRMTERGLRIGRGRRGGYDPQFAHLIADRLIEGRSLLSISRDPDMPNTGVLADWRARHPAFSQAMDRARRAQLDVLLDEVMATKDHPVRRRGAASLAAMVWRNRHRPFGAAAVEAGGRSWAQTVADGTRRERKGKGSARPAATETALARAVQAEAGGASGSPAPGEPGPSVRPGRRSKGAPARR